MSEACCTAFFVVGCKNKKMSIARHLLASFVLSGYQDSNLGPSGPKPDALTGLRYTPCFVTPPGFKPGTA